MRNNVALQWFVVLSFLATVAVNGMANALPLNGLTTGEISDRFPIYFVPAGYVFSIWGVIYLLLGAFVIYQALPAQEENARLEKTRGLFILSCLANIGWIFAWHFEQFVLSLLLMIVLLICLLAIYLRLEMGQKAGSRGELWAVLIPFSIYLGWITVATIGNATTVLDYLRWNGWGLTPEIWAVIMLAVTAVLSAIMAIRKRDAAYLLVIVWALAGIGVKHASVPLVAGTAWAATALVGLLVLFSLWRRSSLEVV